MSRAHSRQGSGSKAVMRKISTQKNAKKRAKKAARAAQLDKQGA